MRVDCALLTIHSSLIGPKQTVEAWSLSNLRKPLGTYRLIQSCASQSSVDDHWHSAS